ncbi:MAG: Nif3-like dinuclear metal center hexameric protein [Gemmatimonadota bacterium]
MTLQEIASHFDELLRTRDIPDHPAALNGVQVECEAGISRVALAVDATQATIEEAIRGDANLLVVHHGLFWDGAQPLTGRRYRRVRALIAADVGLYSSHLPLDVHPELGNNVGLARELGIELSGTFGGSNGPPLGVWGELQIRREALAARLDEVLGGRVKMVPGGPERIERVGVITGGAGSKVAAARAAGLDTFITGEGAHHHYFDAAEGGVNLFLGGHYATEVWGLRALQEHIEQELGLECFFIDRPTGL